MSEDPVYIFIDYLKKLLDTHDMTERLPCKNKDCERTILPATAQRTGGFCMPCVQKKFYEEEQAYIKANEKRVNLYAGITDPVEIIKIYYQPRKYDPLIKYIPLSEPIDQIYLKLDSSQVAHLIAYALQCLETGKEEEEEIAFRITVSLVSLLNVNVSAILDALIEKGIYYPSFIFKSASPAIRDKLFKALQDGSGMKNHLLSALAWIGDDQVVKFFAENGQIHFKELYVKIIKYTEEAGWELNQQQQKRLLYLKQCYPLVKQDTKPVNPLHKTFQFEKETCQGCGSNLMSLVKLDLSDKRLDFVGIDARYLNIGTCLKCDDWRHEGFFMEISRDGQISRSHFSQAPVELSEDSPSWSSPAPLQGCLNLACEPRNPYYAVDVCEDHISYSQVGGFPTWIQETYYPSCPQCKETMVFIAQIANNECFEYDEGIHYFFLCSTCMLTTSTYQQT